MILCHAVRAITDGPVTLELRSEMGLLQRVSTELHRAPGRIVEHMRLPVYSRAYALILSSGATAVLGLLFWTLAAHLYGAADLGINAAVISAMMLLSYFAQLSLAGALTRFIPTAGRATTTLILASYGASLMISAVVAGAFVLSVGYWSPQVRSLVSTPASAVWFVAATMAWSLFALQDAVMTGLKRTVWVPIENIVFAVVKILALVALAGSLTGSGIYVSWTVPAALSIVPISALIFRRFLPSHSVRHGHEEPEGGPGMIIRYLGVDYAAELLDTAAAGVLPLIVLAAVGASASGYYYIAWTIAYSMQLILLNVATSLSVEGAGQRSEIATATRRMLKLLLGLQVPIVAAILVLAPAILMIFGREYSDQGTLLLRLLALGALPHGISSVCLGVARVRRQLRVLFAVQAGQAILFLALAVPLLQAMGIAGVGLGFLVGQSAVAVAVFVTQLGPLLGAGRSRSAIAPAL